MEDHTATPQPRRKNMRWDDRERQILEGAVRFFAECGFEGQTRELAKRLGISHAVIYRHFDSKEALIERVYEHLYTGRWRREWGALITDRTLPLEDRLIRFYRDYADCVFDYDWVRIFILHSPSGVSFEVKIACIRALDKDFLPQAAPAVAQTAGSGRIRPRSRCFLAQGRRFSAQRTDLSSRFRSV